MPAPQAPGEPDGAHSRRTAPWKIIGFTLLQYALLGRVIRHTRQSNAQATLIAPSAYWWPLLAPYLQTSRYLELGSCEEIHTHPADLSLPTHLLPRGQLLAIPHLAGPDIINGGPPADLLINQGV